MRLRGKAADSAVAADDPAPAQAPELAAGAPEAVAPVAEGEDSQESITAMTKIITHTLVVAAVAIFTGQARAQNSFNTPEEARDALIQAASKGMEAVKTFFGPGAADVIRTGDAVQDAKALTRFRQLAAEKTELEPDELNPNRITLNIGVVRWPMAVPLIRKEGRWHWDVNEGRAEIRRRAIGGNELTAIEICHGYVEAQKAYAETDWDDNRILEYAKKLASTEGKKDGLYWPGGDSPVAVGFAKATAEGYQLASGAPKPYHGYFFKILLAQGPDARGGAQDYVVHGLMIGGFAMIAWPAEYGVSGIMTFLVNQDGIVYQKDLGPRTSTLAKAVTTFNPNKTWAVVQEEEIPDDAQ
jgi:hypothetical protein